MDAAELIRVHRQRAELSQRDLAERAGTSAAAICFYEGGERVPRVDTLRRIIEAAGGTLDLEAHAPGDAGGIDLAANARSLELVLELAEALPRDYADELDYPVLRDAAV